jgi:hypothetical protein
MTFISIHIILNLDGIHLLVEANAIFNFHVKISLDRFIQTRNPRAMSRFFEWLPSAKGEFYWEATDEPHASRRKQILGKNIFFI